MSNVFDFMSRYPLYTVNYDMLLEFLRETPVRVNDVNVYHIDLRDRSIRTVDRVWLFTIPSPWSPGKLLVVIITSEDLYLKLYKEVLEKGSKAIIETANRMRTGRVRKVEPHIDVREISLSQTEETM